MLNCNEKCFTSARQLFYSNPQRIDSLEIQTHSQKTMILLMILIFAMSTNGVLVDHSCLLTGLRIYRQLKLERVSEYENRLYEYYMTNRMGSEWKFNIVYDETTKELGLDIDWYSRNNKINATLINRFDGLIVANVYKGFQMNVNCDVYRTKNTSTIDCEYKLDFVNGSQNVKNTVQGMDFSDESIFMRASLYVDYETYIIQYERNRLDRSKQYLVTVNIINYSIARTECGESKHCQQWQFLQELNDELYAHLDSTVFYTFRGKVSQLFYRWEGYLLWFVFDGQPFYCFTPVSTTGQLSPEVSFAIILVDVALTFHLFQCSTRDRLKTFNSYNVCDTTTLATESTEWTEVSEAGQTTQPDLPKLPESPEPTKPSTTADSKTIAPTKSNTPQTTEGKESSKLWIIFVILFLVIIILAILIGVVYALGSGSKGPEEEEPSPAKSPPKSAQRKCYDHLTSIEVLTLKFQNRMKLFRHRMLNRRLLLDHSINLKHKSTKRKTFEKKFQKFIHSISIYF